jgi:phage head maturation protease
MTPMKTLRRLLSFIHSAAIMADDAGRPVVEFPRVDWRECRKAPSVDRERRMIAGRVETRALTDAEKTAGYIGALTGVIPLNTDSVILRDRRFNNGKPFVERIAPKAFEDRADVIAVVGHTDDPLAAVARSGANLTIVESDKEIRWEALLPNTQAGRDLAELGPKVDADGKVVREGIIRGTSFEFELGAEDKWETRADGTSVRTVVRGKLARVNPVLDPAYADSSISVSERGAGRDSEHRGYWVYQQGDFAWSDPTITGDAAFALAQLGCETCALSDALFYLRSTPAGALRDHATAKVAAAAANVAALTAWLAANGATVNPDYLTRAAEKLREAREKSAPPEISETPRESALRILTK